MIDGLRNFLTKRILYSRVIIDASEVKIEMPSNTRANVLCWSSYKHHHTVKFLVGIAPDGTITFISKAYGGRITDGQLTTDCGILLLLETGDRVLADKVTNSIMTKIFDFH